MLSPEREAQIRRGPYHWLGPRALKDLLDEIDRLRALVEDAHDERS